MHRIFTCFCLCSCFFAPTLSAQSPWTQSLAGFYVQGGYFVLPKYKTLFVQPDDKALERTISDATFQLYGEYGISHKTTLVAQIPFRFLNSGSENVAQTNLAAGKAFGIGNANIGIRRSFFQKKTALSGQFDVELPGTTYSETTGLRTGYNALALVPSLSYGKSLRRGYASASISYGFRGNNFSQFARVNAEFGRRFNQLWLIGNVLGQHSFKDGTVQLPANNLATGSYVDQQGYTAYSVKFIYQKNQFLAFGLTYSGAFRADNLPKSPNIGFFTSFKWD